MKRWFLSLLVPGYRALQHGNRRRALAWQGVFVALFVVAGLTSVWSSPAGGALFLVVFVACCIAGSRDGRDRGAPATLQPHEWAWMIAPQVLVVLILAIPAWRRSIVGLEVYVTPTRSNVPTLHAGDRFVVSRRVRPAVRGEMILFRAPDGTGQVHIKRIVGIAGDVVAGGPTGFTVNGHTVRDDTVDAFGPVTVAPGHAFVLGDNVKNSRDSRHYGSIQKEAITGHPLYVVWSKQWRNIGRTLR